MNPATFRSISESSNRSLSGIRRELGDEAGDMYVKALLTFAVIELSEFFNIQHNMSESQVVLTVKLLAEKYWMLKPDDFKLCFKYVMMGRYGKVYNRLDGHVIMEWLDAYLAERTGWFDDTRYAAHEKIKSEDPVTVREREARKESGESDYSRFASDYITNSFKPNRNED